MNLTEICKKFPRSPVAVGVFITRRHARDLIEMSPALVSSSRYIRFIELAEANEDDVTLFFFSRDQVRFDRNQVLGIHYNPGARAWQLKPFPLPHLLYDRGGGMHPQAAPLLRKFRDLGIRNINARHFFDKWDLHFRLSKLDGMRPHLPATVKGESAAHILRVLQQHGSIYVKKRRGSAGLGVIRLERLGPDRFRYDYSHGSRLFSEVFSAGELLGILSRRLAPNSFIIQKPINLIRKGPCNIDFRSEVQRDGTGRLLVSGTTARIGRAGSPITSHTRTGDYFPLEEFLPSILQLDARETREWQEKIHRFLLTVFRSVEEAYGPFGEMGIDFGLDARGQLWLIECNSKSAKVALYHAYGRQKVRQSFRNFLQYAKSLAAERNHRKEGVQKTWLN